MTRDRVEWLGQGLTKTDDQVPVQNKKVTVMIPRGKRHLSWPPDGSVHTSGRHPWSERGTCQTVTSLAHAQRRRPGRALDHLAPWFRKICRTRWLPGHSSFIVGA
jgi:hypothetical protein